MLVWRDKIACHGPIARHIPLSLPLLPSSSWYYRFGALLAAATTPVYAHVSRDMTNSVTPASLIRETSSRLFVQLRDERALRGREASTNHTWIMLEDLWKERNLWRRLERERERGGIWGKERFYDRWFEDKNVDKSLGGCIGCREGKGCVSSWLDQVMVRITICEI